MEEIVELIKNRKFSELKAKLSEMKSADISSILDESTKEDAVIIFRLLSKEKISIKYSLVWLASSFLIFLVGVFPNFVGFFTNLIGFKTTSNLVIGIILSLLLLITLFLTVIINDQKNKIKLLIQEISMLKKEGSKNEKD